MDNVSQLSAAAENVLGGGAAAELEKLIPGTTRIIYQRRLEMGRINLRMSSTLISHWLLTGTKTNCRSENVSGTRSSKKESGRTSQLS